MNLPEAIDILVQALKDDPGYRQAWVANIAMAMDDEARSYHGPVLDPEALQIYNAGAERFLQNLCHRDYNPKLI